MCLSAAAIAGIAGVGSAAAGAISADKSSKALTATAQRQEDLQREMYGETTQRFAPFLQSGERSLGAYNYEMGMGDRPEGYGGMQASPAFDFMMNQGTDAINASAAMRGKMNSGSTLQAMEKYRMGLASQESNNWLNRLQGGAAMGQASAGNMAAAGQNFATGAGTAMANAGSAQAAGAIGVGNAIAGGINTGMNAYGYFNNLNQQPSPAASTMTAPVQRPPSFY